jgi:hypothetical protein
MTEGLHKVAADSGTLTRSSSPRKASTVHTLSKPNLSANCPRRSLGAVTSGIVAFHFAIRGELVAQRSRRPAVERTSPKSFGEVPASDAKNASGDSTELDTKSLPPRWRRVLWPPVVPSLSKVNLTVHLVNYLRSNIMPAAWRPSRTIDRERGLLLSSMAGVACSNARSREAEELAAAGSLWD